MGENLPYKAKVCTRCTTEREISFFRQRYCIRNHVKYFYPNNHCKDCERKEANHYYHLNREEHSRKAREYARRTRPARNAYQRKWREEHPDQLKARVKAYREKNRAKIIAQEKITKRRYWEKQRDVLSDVYIIRMLLQRGRKHQSVITREGIKAHPELIEMQRKSLIDRRNGIAYFTFIALPENTSANISSNIKANTNPDTYISTQVLTKKELEEMEFEAAARKERCITLSSEELSMKDFKEIFINTGRVPGNTTGEIRQY